MVIPSNVEEQIFNLSELRGKVLDKIGSLLEEAGVQTDEEIIGKEVKGEDSNPVFRIDSGDRAFALKVFSDSKESGQFYSNKMFEELLMKNRIPTPKIIYSSNNNEILPDPWIMWEWFSGDPSSEIESETERHDIAVQTGIELRKIHEIKMPGFGNIDSNSECSGKDIKWTISFFVKRIQNLIEKGGAAFSEEELRDILRVTAESEELLSFSKPRLLHGDITGGNVLVSNSGSITFIDPGEIISGDPMSDLGYSQTTRLSPIFREGVLKGYTKEKPLTEEEYSRFLRWRLLRQSVIACNSVLNNDKNAQNYINDAKIFLEQLKYGGKYTSVT